MAGMDFAISPRGFMPCQMMDATSVLQTCEWANIPTICFSFALVNMPATLQKLLQSTSPGARHLARGYNG